MLCFSHEELVHQGYASSDNQRDLLAGLEKLETSGTNLIILHRGSAPTIARLEGRLLEVITPQVTPLDHRGGGDTFLAALAAGLMRQQSIEESIRFAAAAGTLNVTRHGLGTGRFEDIVDLSQHVQIRPLDERAK